MPGKNGKIAFFGAGRPATINPDGTGRTELPRIGEFPTWSPDGTRLAFAPCFVFFDLDERLCITDADGSNVRRLPGIEPAWPTWAPSGDRLAVDDRACTPTHCSLHAVVTIRVDGSDRRALDFDGGTPDWSPDGTKIAFYRYYPFDDHNAADLFVVNADGTGLTQLTGAEQSYEAVPSWSPDGEQIAYNGPAARVWVMNSEGMNRRELTHVPSGNPVWSPEGTQIAYERADGIHVMNADGSEDRFLTVGNTPDWQPIPGPRRSDFANAARFCKAERDFWGEEAFARRYGSNGNNANAFGKCVSASG
jgi:Tol biopolymer transport system component